VSLTEFCHDPLRSDPQSRSNSTINKAVGQIPDDITPNCPSLSGVVDAILEVGRQRDTLLMQLRAALESGREKDALVLARRLCGLSL
jgi:hypothetical protein